VRALILIAILVGIPVAAAVALLWLPRRRPASDADLTGRSVTPPDPTSPGITPSPRRDGEPVPGSQADRRRHGKP
jgi:hypothetical protein